MKGIIFDIKKYAIHDGPGIRTTVFFKGCPLTCWWCHNPESQNIEPEKLADSDFFNSFCNSSDENFGKQISVEEVMHEIEKDSIFYDESNGGVTFSGGEPLMQNDFLLALLKKCTIKGIHTTVDTSGYAIYDLFNKIYEFTNIFLYDLKIMDDNIHQKFTSVSNQLILENLKKLTDRGDKVVIRIPLIPAITDTEKNLDDIIKFISTLKNIREIDLLPYNKIGEGKYPRLNIINQLGQLKTQSETELFKLREKFNILGVDVNIRG